MKFVIVCLIFIILVFADKALTMMNLNILAEDNPDNYLTAEKNPAARWFFDKFGLLWGSLLFGLTTVCTLFIVFYLGKMAFGEYKMLWIIFLIYGLTLANNSFYLLKNARII